MSNRSKHCDDQRGAAAAVNAARSRVESLFDDGWAVGDVVAFHTREKYLILAHDEAAYRQLGPLVARAASMDREAFADEYSRLFTEALAHTPTVGSHTNVLQHLAGFFRDAPGGDRESVRAAVDDFRAGDRTLASTKAVVADAAIRNDFTLVMNATYLQPISDEVPPTTFVPSS